MSCRGASTPFRRRKTSSELSHRDLRPGHAHRGSTGTWEISSLPHGGGVAGEPHPSPRPDSGTPQGGVISPILANVYLHGVLDEWLERDVRPQLSGRAFLVRYDFVIGF